MLCITEQVTALKYSVFYELPQTLNKNYDQTNQTQEKTFSNASILTHWGRVTHICVSILTIIASDNGLSLGRRQAIIWTNAGILLNGPLWTYFNEMLIEILTFSFKKMRLKVSSAKWRPFCLGLNVLSQTNIFKVWLNQHIKSLWCSTGNTCEIRKQQLSLWINYRTIERLLLQMWGYKIR